MRLNPAVKVFAVAATLAGSLFLLSTTALAQQGTPDNTATRQSIAGAMNSSNPQAALQQIASQQMQGGGYSQQAQGVPGQVFSNPFAPAPEEMTQADLDLLLKNPDSAQYKANKLAEQAKRDGVLINFADAQETVAEQTPIDVPTPPEMDELQDIHRSHATDFGVVEDSDGELMAIDIRRDAQKEAALSYGARGGLAKKAYQISERLKGYEKVLDGVFSFRALLVKAPSGMLIEPPIVRESLDALTIINDGNEAAVADRILNISKQAKIVSAPREWRQYLYFPYTAEIAPPPKVLWPKNADEQVSWNGWVRQGWDAGFQQGEDTFENNLNKLVADYNGMVRYRMLLAQGMISQPFALHEDRGVTGSKSEMRVGDRAVRITGPSQFLTGSELWKPADR